MHETEDTLKVHWWVFAVVVALLATTGCGDRGAQPGRTLDLGQGEGRICVPAPADPSAGVTFGDTVIRHSAAGPVTITEVSLVDPVDLELREAVLVPVVPGEDVLVGMRHTSDLEGLPPRWEDRVDASEAVVGPGENWNLVLVVGSPQAGDTGSAAATRITYNGDEGRMLWQDTTTAIYVTTRSCSDVLAETAGDHGGR